MYASWKGCRPPQGPAGWRRLVLLGLCLQACTHPRATERADAELAASPPPPPPPDSWMEVKGHPCYVPPEFEQPDPQARKFARSRGFAEASRRWRGEKDPAFHLDERLLEQLEDGLMTAPDRIEQLLREDLQRCQSWGAGTLEHDVYMAWFQGRVDWMAGEDCSHPSFTLITQYLEVNQRWQLDTLLCKDEVVLIRANSGEYTVEAKPREQDTVWITSEGDPTQPTREPPYPCRQEGCLKGQLVGRFVDRSGHEQVFPVGKQRFFTAPAHGRLSFGVNDVDLFDNAFRVKDQVADYLSVEIFPATRTEGE